jgi:hypothetical protein
LSLKKVFICAQAFWAFRKIPDAWKNSDILGICNVAWSFRAPYYKGWIFFWFLPIVMGALSHERENMLARTILEALVNMWGQINLLIPPSLTWSQI